LIVEPSEEAAMAYVMCQYDRPSDTRNWTEYNKHVRDWIAQLLKVPGAISFVAYRTADGSSPNTITMLEFRTVEEARQGAISEEIKPVLDGLRPVGSGPKVLIVKRSPFTPNQSGPKVTRSRSV
jgi:hypothetical protein